MFKNYLALNEAEKQGLLEFVNQYKAQKLSLDEMDKQLMSEVYDFGRGIITKHHGGMIIGKAYLILKECKFKGIVYVTDFGIREGIEDEKAAAKELLEEVKRVAEGYGAHRIYLGTKDERTIETLNSLHLYGQYSAVVMHLENRAIQCPTLSLIPLSESNKLEYLRIYNDAFEEVPNGETLVGEDIDGYIKDTDENKSYFVVKANQENIGFIQFDLEGDKGQFDLGVLKSYRGKGYGKQLLETAIDYLNAKDTPQVSLMVITKNGLAYEMYKRRGFKVSKVLSHWFELNQ